MKHGTGLNPLDSNIRFTHRELVEKSKTGDRPSQYKLYGLYVDSMYNTGLRILGTKEDAEDIVQDSFVDAFNKLASFNYESTFGTWLKRIVINKSINHLKLKRIPVTSFHDREYYVEEDPSPNSGAMDIQKVKRGIERLPRGYKQIINLYLIEGYDHNEIGEIMGISTSTSKSQYHRAKKKLIEIVKSL